MSKDYRHQREWDSIENEDDFGKGKKTKRHEFEMVKQSRSLKRKHRERNQDSYA